MQFTFLSTRYEANSSLIPLVESQGAGLTFDLEGSDAQVVTMLPAPTLDSQELVTEMIEQHINTRRRTTMQGIYSLNSPEYTQENQIQEGLLFPRENMALCRLKIEIAKLVCHLIPASCPFARDILLFGHTLHIPPLCKLNPLYNYLMNLRWQALTFLADVGVENI